MSATLPYFRSVAAVISYVPAGYVRLDWQPVAVTPEELRAVYEHTLRAMLRHGIPSLLSVHNQRPPMPPEVQAWLTTNWIPRAMATVGYHRCAIVEALTPLGRLAARAVGTSLTGPLHYQYFGTVTAAEEWLCQ